MSRTYTQQQVTEGLTQLVANGGNVAKTAKQVDIPDYTLRAWKADTHAEQYRRLEEQFGTDLERQAVELARARMVRASEIEGELLEKAAQARPDMVPQALRAVADVKSKATNQVLQLTGRPLEGKEASGVDIMKMLESMQARGIAKLAVGVELRTEEAGAAGDPATRPLAEAPQLRRAAE